MHVGHVSGHGERSAAATVLPGLERVEGFGEAPRELRDTPSGVELWRRVQRLWLSVDAARWRAFRRALDAWWQGQREPGSVGEEVSRLLGERDPVKNWLVRLFLKKLTMLEEGGRHSLQSLVHPGPAHSRGAREPRQAEDKPHA